MCVHHVRSAFLYQIDKRMHYTRVGHRWMKWTLGIFIESVQCSIPAVNPMDRNPAIHFSASGTRLGEGDDLDFMTTPDEFMGKHTHVQVTSTRQWWRIRIGGLKDSNLIKFSYLRH